jgi:hypothetical protein
MPAKIPFLSQKVTEREIDDVLDLKGQLKEYDAVIYNKK